MIISPIKTQKIKIRKNGRTYKSLIDHIKQIYLKKSIIIFLLIIIYIYLYFLFHIPTPITIDTSISIDNPIPSDTSKPIDTSIPIDIPISIPIDIQSTTKPKISLKEYQASVFPEIISFEKNLGLTQQVFDDFRKINSENKLLENSKEFKRSLNPDISIIITMYNQAHCIHKGLRSIQNQSFKNIEIIIVDDCSLDNSTDVIKEFQKEDERIILFSHDTNEGEMKSRTDGIRKAKGKYITILDGDDAYIHKDVLKNSLFIAEKGEFDVVEFNWVIYRGLNLVYKNSYGFTDLNHILYQPELNEKFIYAPGYSRSILRNRIIWGKLIKNEFFNKVLIDLGSEYADDYINEAEDTIVAINIFRLAESYYVMKEIGYIYSVGEKDNRFPLNKNKMCKINDKIKKFGFYKFFKFMIDKYSDTDVKKNLIVCEMKSNDLNKYFNMTLGKIHYQIMFYVYDTILKWTNLSILQKNYINDLRNKAIEKKNKDNC